MLSTETYLKHSDIGRLIIKGYNKITMETLIKKAWVRLIYVDLGIYPLKYY